MDSPEQSGSTHSDWVAVATSVPGGARATLDGTPQGLPIWKGPAGRITAIDLNTGEHLWMIPHGDASQAEQDRIRNNPLLQGVDGVMVNRGRGGHSTMVASPTLLFATGQTADGAWKLFAIDKQTGERVGAVDIPGSSRYGMSSWTHEGKQYIIIQLNDGIAAMALP
jgi:quinoprotein glucose dehydrogenase